MKRTIYSEGGSTRRGRLTAAHGARKKFTDERTGGTGWAALFAVLSLASCADHVAPEKAPPPPATGGSLGGGTSGGSTSSSTGGSATSAAGGSSSGGGSSSSSGGTSSSGGGGAITNGGGPRSLSPTFVNIEVAQFPRPAAEACADNKTGVTVKRGESIFRAVAGAQPGTTVWVEPGTYREVGDGTAALVWNVDNVCLRAKDGGTVVLQPGAVDVTYGLSPQGDDNVVEGFVVEGFQYGVALWTANGETQRRLTLQRMRIEKLVGGSPEGVVAYGDNREESGRPYTVDGLLLLDVHIDGVDLGISCNAGPCAHWWVEGSSVRGRANSLGSGADTFAIEEGRQIVIAGSTFAEAAADGIDTKAEDVVVYGARVLNVQRNGVKLWHGGDVINTVVDGTGGDAALIGDQPGHYRYLHTLVANHGGPGATQYTGTWGYDTDSTAFNIEFVNCIFFQDATGGLYANNGAQVSMRNTIFQDGGKFFEFGKGGSTYLTGDLGGFESAGFGSGNQIGDPGFANLAGGEYSTQPSSIARDKGLAVSGLAVDYLGRARSQGAGPDIGPVESTP